MNLAYIPMLATVITTAIHVGVLILFLKTFNLGILGIIYANTLTNSIQFLIILIYAGKKQSIKESIFWPDYDSFNAWKPYLTLSIPSTVMLCAEWWYFELLTLVAGYIGVNE
jgi:MATE family multidrug resistance protein